MILTPYPLIYCPKGVAKPSCCPHGAAVGLLAGHGPDAVDRMEDGHQVTEGGGGLCYGGGYQPGSPGWTKTRGGWWVQLRGQRPQDLLRLQAHPRVQRWYTIPGAHPGQEWRIPALIEEGPNGWTSALDGIWDGESYHGGDLAPLQTQLLAVVNDAAQTEEGDHPDALLAAIRALGIAILAVGQWVDEDLLIAGRYLSELTILSAITSACSRQPT